MSSQNAVIINYNMDDNTLKNKIITYDKLNKRFVLHGKINNDFLLKYSNVNWKFDSEINCYVSKSFVKIAMIKLRYICIGEARDIVNIYFNNEVKKMSEYYKNHKEEIIKNKKNHKKEIKTYNKAYREKHKIEIGNKKRTEYNNNKEIINSRKKEKYRINPEIYMFRAARKRAKEKGLEFSITEEGVRIALEKTKNINGEYICPVFNIKMEINKNRSGDNSFTIDRIDNSKGYIPSNIAIISWRANSLKRDATIDELRNVLNYIENFKQ